jgi:hypothetical protein
MPNPFPGMDPWLESPDVWPGFHDKLINETVRIMQPQLRERGYYIDSGERVWLMDPGRAVTPDNVVFATRPARQAGDAGTVAVLEPDEPVRVKQQGIEVRETYLEIFDARGHRLVTGIEFISPTNKSDHQGRALYERKQQELEEAGVNLVEIDLIRRGPPVVDVPDVVVEGFRPWDYLVNLVRRGSQYYEFYPIGLRDRLPRIRIPLKLEEPDAVLDLQKVFDQASSYGPYPERIDYTSAPSTPLSREDDLWADQRLRSVGLRP